MRIVTTGGVLLAVPHVAGFAAGPTAWQVPTSAPPQPSAFSLRSPHEAGLRAAHRHRSGPGATITAAQSAWSSQEGSGCRRYRRRQRQLWATPASRATETGGHVTTTTTSALQATLASTLGDHDVDHHEPSIGTTASAGVDVGLRLAVIGPNADELGLRMAERHGLAATSMEELMKGRKGRRTDAVKAKAASKWLGEEKGAAGGIITGFPTTAAQAESLEKQGVALEHLVVVVREGLDGGPANGSENEEEEVEAEVLLTHYEGKVVKVATETEGDIESLCDSVARLVVTLPPPGSRDASSVSSERAAGAGDGGGSNGAADFSSEEKAGEEAEAQVELEEGYNPLLASIATMSPSERQLAKERDPASYEAAVGLSRSGAEAKRAVKEKTKQKKRDANEAQQMDTPFYVAVAQGQPKARFRPQVPMVPSRITERLQSAASAPEGEEGGAAANTRLEFGPLVIDSPASDCLLAAGITEPTGIQAAGMGPILAGESVILHAMTGSGKTLTFLLPLMQRWAPELFSHAAAAAAAAGGGGGGEGEGASAPDGPFRVLLALPTRELAVQVAREVVLLSGGLTASVELLVDSSVFHDLSSVKAPIVVGSAKVLERLIRKSRPTVRADVLPRVKCIVVDEVDRLVDVLSKHAPPKEVEKRKRHARPIAALLERVLQSSPDVQVVACSATIGRPLRRELGHIVRRASALGSVDGVNADGDNGGGGGGGSGTSGSRELRVIRDPLGASSVENLANERAVAIPDTIRHYAVPLAEGDFFSRLEGLTAAVRELQPRRPLIFVPPGERVTAVVAHLRRSGGDIGRRAVALHEAMGFLSDEETGGVRGQHASEAIQQHDRLTEEFRGVSTAGEGEDGGGGMGDADLLSGSGVGGRIRDGEALLVTGEESARGLHFDDVDFVFLMQRPKSPDEYVHLAGRTGRQGRTGTVVTLVEFEEFRRLQAWSNSLKVHFEPLDILKVVKQ